jgi:hypothetical protein
MLREVIVRHEAIRKSLICQQFRIASRRSQSPLSVRFLPAVEMTEQKRLRSAACSCLCKYSDGMGSFNPFRRAHGKCVASGFKQKGVEFDPFEIGAVSLGQYCYACSLYGDGFFFVHCLSFLSLAGTVYSF